MQLGIPDDPVRKTPRSPHPDNSHIVRSPRHVQLTPTATHTLPLPVPVAPVEFPQFPLTSQSLPSAPPSLVLPISAPTHHQHAPLSFPSHRIYLPRTPTLASGRSIKHFPDATEAFPTIQQDIQEKPAPKTSSSACPADAHLGRPVRHVSPVPRQAPTSVPPAPAIRALVS